ncbi:MAG: heparinase II/III family protein, partial [bacterium]
MTLIVTAAELEARRAVAAGELAPLAVALRGELAPLVDAPPEVPREKALLSRSGGRCIFDRSLLRFDPYDSRHFCPTCGREYVGGLQDRFRLYWYQLWLAERVLHAALLGVLTDDAGCLSAATTLLDRHAEQYLRLPNADNVLGPSRPFFSTYLESIWLLQLAIALGILEAGAPSPELSSLGARVRDRIIAPSAALIASFDEGMSNRQVWNNAALMASARLLDDRVLFERALHGPSGFEAHLGNALLSDGSWYEGENYHLFAHRGLWYGERIARTAGHTLPAALDDRYHEGFAAPFRTILPDLTYPARRDSQHAVSIRQPRFAEACELGLVHRDDERLTSMLARLYDPDVPIGETGRDATSADVERNVPATGLTRFDLSWRTLLCALPTLPPLVAQPLRSDLLPAQGIGVLRRDEGAVYVSLDYGHSGGGHGHPDRLNLTLADGARRWFDDPGTGSYVDPTLHWYRSTLAHNAPLVDGHSQPRVHGALLAFADDDRAGWISAQAELAPGLIVRRSVVVSEDYLVDELYWEGSEAHEIALPIHGVSVVGEHAKSPSPIAGRADAEDGFSYLADTARVHLPVAGEVRLRATMPDGALLSGWTFAGADATVWSATVPALPECDGRLPLLLVRKRAHVGTFLSVWSWNGAVTGVDRADAALTVTRSDGATHRYLRTEDGWIVEQERELITLSEVRKPFLGEAVFTHNTPPGSLEAVSVVHTLPAVFEMGEPHYRRSEFTWQGAGAPHATVTVTRPTPGTVLVEVDVPASQRLFVPLTTENQLDNEPASINGDSVQLYAIAGARSAGLLLVPDPSSVSMRQVDGWTNDLAVDARWRPTSAGYRLEATLHIGGGSPEFALDVIVNEVVAGRARRRGQLVLSGGAGEFIYLR